MYDKKLVLNLFYFRPRFTQKTFTGGVSTSSDYGTEILTLSATDTDTPANAKLKYFIIDPITMSLSEGLSHLINNDNPLFSIDPLTGALSLAFDPQPDMKGHFSFNVGVNDTTGLNDKSKVLIYLLRDDQKVFYFQAVIYFYENCFSLVVE
jgi:hypothetical protein